MALVLKDRTKETSSTTGTGTYTLAGAATGFQSFSGIGNGNTTYYTSTDGTDWEVGVGTYTSAGTTLARTTILASSNAGSAVNWAAGTRTIFCGLPAGKAVILDASGNALGLGAMTATSIKLGGGAILSTYDVQSTTCTVAFATPGSSSFVYTAQTLDYVQVGSVIHFWIDLAFTPTLGTASGAFTVVVPWTAGAHAVFTAGEFGVNWTWAASRTMIVGRQTNGATIITLSQQGAAIAASLMSTTAFTTGNAYTLRLTGVVRV